MDKKLTAAAIEAAFGQTGDFGKREIRAGGETLQLYFIDGLVTGGFVSDYVLRPLMATLEQGGGKDLLKVDNALAVSFGLQNDRLV